MTPPPSATANLSGMDYAPEDIHAMMEELQAKQGGAFKRAIIALAMIGFGCAIALCILSYNPFDSTGDTAGLGSASNLLGESGAKISNILMQVTGWGSLIFASLFILSGLKRIFKPRPSALFLVQRHYRLFQSRKTGQWPLALADGQAI